MPGGLLSFFSQIDHKRLGIGHLGVLVDNQHIGSQEHFGFHPADNSHFLRIQKNEGPERINPDTLDESFHQQPVKIFNPPLVKLADGFMGLNGFLERTVGGDRIVKIDDPGNLAAEADGLSLESKGIAVAIIALVVLKGQLLGLLGDPFRILHDFQAVNRMFPNFHPFCFTEGSRLF